MLAVVVVLAYCNVHTLYHASETIITTVVDKHYCGGTFAYCGGSFFELCWIITTLVGYDAYMVVVFAYCDGLSLLWWVTLLGVVV